MFYLLGLLALLLNLAWYQVGLASTSEPVPPGFYQVSATPGVIFYQKDYSNGSPDYVQLIDLDLGAKVLLLHGEILQPGQDQGVYGGNNPRFERQSIQQFWSEFEQQIAGAFCVSNGQFFRMADSPTPLPFPLKVDGQILTDGYGIKEFPEKKLILEIWSDHLDIRELSPENLYNSAAPDIVAGLAENAEKAAKKAVGRTFVGIRDTDLDGDFETLLLLNTRTAKPENAADVLRSFGAAKVMMLDGGGSTQLVCQGKSLIDTERLIPQALGIALSQIPDYAFKMPAASTWLVASQQSDSANVLRLRNTGLQTWRPGEHQISLEDRSGSYTSSLELPNEISSGEFIELSWSSEAPEEVQIVSLDINLSHSGEILYHSAEPINLVLLPEPMAGLQDALQSQLAEWSNQPGVNVNDQVLIWLAQQSGVSAQVKSIPASEALIRMPSIVKLDLSDAILIPLIMIPMLGLMLFVVRRIQHPIE